MAAGPPRLTLPVVTERLGLRGFEPTDAPAILAIYGDPEVLRFVGELGLDAVTAVADAANPASAHVLLKLGFTEEEPRIAYGRPHRAFRLRCNHWVE